MELLAEPRTVLGKRVAGLRRQGLTPASLYGKGLPSIAIQASTPGLNTLLRRASRNDVISLTVGSTTYPVVVRLVQRLSITQQVLHVDFMQVSTTESMLADVALNFVGIAPSVEAGTTTLLKTRDSIEVSGIASALPSSIQIDTSTWDDPAHHLKARDIPLPDGVTLMSDPDATVAMLVGAHVAVDEDAETKTETTTEAATKTEAEEK